MGCLESGMPEGDTIYRTAMTLAYVLKGEIVTGARLNVPGLDGDTLTGRRVTDVRTHGKNLLIYFDAALILYTHLRMKGSWHTYRTGESWQRPERQARIVLRTARHVAVCFRVPVVEVMSVRDVKRHPVLSRLGPDIMGPSFDYEAARGSLRAYGDLPIAEALLAQGAVAGLGNVYKSEVLFVAGFSPFVRVSTLSDQALEQLLRTARRLMLQNRDGGPRVTRNSLSGRCHWVYGRSGRPCLPSATSASTRPAAG